MRGLLFSLLLLTLSPHVLAITYRNYECTDDCSGHEAGYNWAEANDIDDDSYCNTESSSFNEGCASYVEENAGSESSYNEDEDEEEDEDY